MRINKALSITWEQVDSDTGYVTVGESKTEAGGGRTIPLDQTLLGRLTALRAEHYVQMQYRDWNPTGLVLCTNAGNFNSYQKLQNRLLTPMLKEAGFPRLTWHHLRHNTDSYLLGLE